MSWQLPIVTTTDCCLSKIQVEFVVQDNETQELLDLKSIFDVFKNGFREVIQNKDKMALAKSLLKKKIEVQYIESDIRILEILKIEN